MHTRRVVAGLRLLLMAALVPSAAIVTSWVIGDLSEAQAPSTDRAMDPLPLSPSAEAALGSSATLVLVAGVAAAISALRAGGLSRRAAVTVFPLVGLAVFLALGYRINTAAVIGANIGAGWWFMVSFVAVPSLIWLSVRNWQREDPSADHPAGPPATDR